MPSPRRGTPNDGISLDRDLQPLISRRAAVVSLAAICAAAAESLAQAPAVPPTRPQPMPPKAAPPVVPKQPVPGKKGEEEKPAEPEDISLETKDGVILRCTYYAGKLGKKAVPVMMLHGWEGQRSDYRNMALYVQSLGHAVVTVDLRGHGQSMQARLPTGDTRELNREMFRARDLEAMVLDVEAVKKFLVKKNNDGDLNVEALTIIAADFSCIVAMRWSVVDWNAPLLPSFKQGQDVKALVLLSPLQTFKGLTNRDAMAHPVIRGKLSTMIAAGNQNTKSLADAKRLHGILQTHHIKPPTDPDERRKKLDLFLMTPDTSLQGAELLGPGLDTPRAVANFIELRLVAKLDEYSWSERINPLGQ